jgi:Flp pilus assembly protein TadG
MRGGVRMMHRAGRKAGILLYEVSGAELFEMALILPILLVLVVGVMDFATAFNLRQKLANAAREGARLGASEPTLDITQSSPPTVQDIHDAVVTYLQNANVSTSFIGSSMTSAGSFTWTYYSSGSYGLKVEREAAVPSGCGSSPSNPCIFATRVTLAYPYNWTFGFNRIVTLLGGSGFNGRITLPAAGTMENLP